MARRAHSLDVSFTVLREPGKGESVSALACLRRRGSRACALGRGEKPAEAMSGAVRGLLARRYLPAAKVREIEDSAEQVWGEQLVRKARR